MKSKTIQGLGVGVLLAFFAIQSFWAIKTKSPHYDENMMVGSGISFWKTGDFRLANINPPLSLLLAGTVSLYRTIHLPLEDPSWAYRNSYEFSEHLMYDLKNDPDIILTGARLCYLVVALILGVLIFAQSNRLWGPEASWFSLGLYVFSPTMLAYGSVVSNDMLLSLFFFLSVISYLEFLETNHGKALVWTSLWTFLACSSKLAGLLLVPTIALLGVSTALLRHWNRKQIFSVGALTTLALASALAALLILFRNLYGSAMKPILLTLDLIHQKNYPPFLLNHYSSEGWRTYYLLALLTKTTIPMLVLTGWGIMTAIHKSPSRGWIQIIPIGIIITMASLSRYQMGLRYILPIYPFLFLWAGRGASLLWSYKPTGAPLVLALLIWHIASALRIGPHYLAYFNELAGGPSQGYRILVDSNLDWGQDLKSLKQYIVMSGNPEVILSYFGTARPEAYGIKYQDLLSLSTPLENHVNSLKPSKEILVVSATNLQGMYYTNHAALHWCQSLKPIASPGYSLLVYDVTDNVQAHCRMGEIYLRRKEEKKAVHECQRVVGLIPNSAAAYYNLGFAYETFRKNGLAKTAYLKALSFEPREKMIKEALHRLSA